MKEVNVDIQNPPLGFYYSCKEEKIRCINKTEIDRMIGAKVAKKDDDCFFHWARKIQNIWLRQNDKF